MSQAAEPQIAVAIEPGPAVGDEVRDALLAVDGRLSAALIEQVAFIATALIGREARSPAREAPPGVEMRLWASPGLVRVELENHTLGSTAEWPPGIRGRSSVVDSWRLQLLERLADRWGVVKDERVTLWFELRHVADGPIQDHS